MQLLGLSLFELFALLGAASALTLLLHLLRAQERRVRVPFLPLWEEVVGDRESTRLFARLARLFSLLLALAIAFLLIFALADPRPRAAAFGVSHRVLAIDTGLAMQAQDVPGGRMAAALTHAQRLVEQAGPLLPTALVRFDAAAAPLGPFSSDPAELARALTQLRARDAVSDAERARAFAVELLGARRPAEIVILGDGAPLPQTVVAALAADRIVLRSIGVGQRTDNVALTALAARRYPLDRNRSELLVGLHNASSRPARVELTLLGDEQPLDVRTLELAAGAQLQRIYDDLAFSGTRVEARLRVLEGPSDVLPTDDRAYAVLPERKRMRVLCVTPGNRYLEAALLLDEYFDIEVVAPSPSLPLRDYDAVVFDRFAPPVAPPVPALYLGVDAPWLFTSDGTLERPRFDELRDKHPVLRHASLRDVNIGSALRVQPRDGDVVLARSTAASSNGALIVAGQRAGQPFVALGFDVRKSDLPLRVAWPLLLVNTLDWFAGESKALAPSAVLGELVRAPVDTDAANVLIEAPDGDRAPARVEEGSVAFAPVQVGFHHVLDAGTRAVLATLAVNFDPSAPLRLSAAPHAAELAATPRAPEGWTLLVLLALALIVLEWLAFHRRWAP
jgi:hypothetical protein